MTQHTNPVPVTQLMRDMAAEFFWNGHNRRGLLQPTYDAIREGRLDNHENVQHLAEFAHRLAQSTPADAPSGEGVVEALRSALVFLDKAVGEGLEQSGLDAHDIWNGLLDAAGSGIDGPDSSEEFADRILAALRTAADPEPAGVQEVVARPLDEWHEDHGDVVWWKFPIDEPAWIGCPLDSHWPGYHTHWTPHPDVPALPQPPADEVK